MTDKKRTEVTKEPQITTPTVNPVEQLKPQIPTPGFPAPTTIVDNIKQV